MAGKTECAKMKSVHRGIDASEFEALLVHYLEAIERGDVIDRVQVVRDHPLYSELILDFLAQQNQFRQAMSELKLGICETETVVSAENGENQNQNRSTGSTWSLTNLEEVKYPVEFGDYDLLAEIDRGGMGIVFKANHRKLNRIVALKVMRSADFCSAEEKGRFRAEAESSAAINHPNILSIFEVGEMHGLMYFTMAYVDGETLAALARRKRLTLKESARIIGKIANAVDTAHHCGIIHRDLKPSNILIGQGGEPFLIDFGLAKVTRSNQALTCTGQILGTPAYMSPEQARGESLTTRSDVYSLGAVFYELVAGQAPFSGPTPIDILLQVLNLDPPSPRKINPQIPRSLNTLVHRAMAKDPADRYESAGRMAEDLQRFILDEPIEHPKPSLVERLNTWWRREPALVSHLCAIITVLAIVSIAIAVRDTRFAASSLTLSLLTIWAIGSWVFQRVSVIDRYQIAAFWSWAAFDIVIYTTLIYFAETPRALLLIGYPMMIAASGLFYRVRFVVFVTAMCIVGFMILLATVTDTLTQRPEFCVIYVSGLLVLALCLISMIRRVRGLADYSARNR